MHMTNEGIKKGTGTLNPYKRTEAETIAWAQGVTSATDKEKGVYITAIHNTDYIKVRDVNFGEHPIIEVEKLVGSFTFKYKV